MQVPTATPHTHGGVGTSLPGQTGGRMQTGGRRQRVPAGHPPRNARCSATDPQARTLSRRRHAEPSEPPSPPPRPVIRNERVENEASCVGRLGAAPSPATELVTSDGTQCPRREMRRRTWHQLWGSPGPAPMLAVSRALRETWDHGGCSPVCGRLTPVGAGQAGHRPGEEEGKEAEKKRPSGPRFLTGFGSKTTDRHTGHRGDPW